MENSLSEIGEELMGNQPFEWFFSTLEAVTLMGNS